MSHVFASIVLAAAILHCRHALLLLCSAVFAVQAQWTALHYAAWGDFSQVREVLLRAGADIHAKTNVCSMFGRCPERHWLKVVLLSSVLQHELSGAFAVN